MFARSALNYTTVTLRQQQILRSYSQFNKTTKSIRNQLYVKSPLSRPTTTTLKSTPLQHVQLQIYRIKHSSSNTNNSNTTTKFVAIRRLWKNVFGKYLLITNIVGSGVLMVFGDVIAQEIEYRRGIPNSKRYDWQRMGRMFIVGALQGPLHHYVYNWMDKVMPVANFKNVMKKILIDELLMSPACIFIFFYSACFLERKTFKETNDELKEKFLFIYMIDWLLWPGAQYINFRYLETKYRVTFVNVCTALYNIFMSYVKHDHNEQL
ncbi:mpv17-like protein 2 [Calliphora vicina]|uniref:mpv17-like protein 2 n=1 Tax=Calliphora vicina TaxID=7373 RepID=UPI00325B0455